MRIFLTGIGLTLAGFAFAIVFVNIPYQDPPPELQKRWEFHNWIANMIMLLGLAVSLAGALGIVWRRLRSSRRSS